MESRRRPAATGMLNPRRLASLNGWLASAAYLPLPRPDARPAHEVITPSRFGVKVSRILREGRRGVGRLPRPAATAGHRARDGDREKSSGWNFCRRAQVGKKMAAHRQNNTSLFPHATGSMNRFDFFNPPHENGLEFICRPRFRLNHNPIIKVHFFVRGESEDFRSQNGGAGEPHLL